MSVFLPEKFIVGFAIKVFLGTGGFALMQPNNIILLPHFITVDGAERGRETTETGNTENATILDTVVGLGGERGAHHSVDNTGAAVGEAAGRGVRETIPEPMEPAAGSGTVGLGQFLLVGGGTVDRGDVHLGGSGLRHFKSERSISQRKVV